MSLSCGSALKPSGHYGPTLFVAREEFISLAQFLVWWVPRKQPVSKTRKQWGVVGRLDACIFPFAWSVRH